MGDHMISVYASQNQRWGVLTPFLTAGMLLRQQVMVIAPESTIPEVRERLRTAGIDVRGALSSRQLLFVGQDELPVREYRFDEQAVIDFLHGATESARASGWTALRVAAEWPWFVNELDLPGLLRYEANVNREFRLWPAILMCLYDISELQPGTVTDLVSTHPLVVLGDKVVENELYVPEEGRPGGVGDRLH